MDLNNKKIAVLGLKRIGDAVYTLPAFEAIKHQYPTSTIELFTESQVTAIYQYNPFLDEIHSFPRKNYWSSVLRALRQNNFDACIVWHNALKYALLPFLAGVPVRLGYQKEMRSIFLTHKRPLHKTVVHRLEHMALLLDKLEVNSRGLLPSIYHDAAEMAQSETLLGRYGLEAGGYIAFIVGSIAETRRWFPENFAEVAQRIVAECQLQVIILGGPDDREIADHVMKSCGDNSANIQNIAGQTTLRETIMLFKQSAAVVTNDTGPLHIASAVGVPVVTWFGAANEQEIKPPSIRTVVLNAQVSCAPCVDEMCSQHTLECLHKISPGWVMDSLKQVIGLAAPDTHRS